MFEIEFICRVYHEGADGDERALQIPRQPIVKRLTPNPATVRLDQQVCCHSEHEKKRFSRVVDHLP